MIFTQVEGSNVIKAPGLLWAFPCIYTVKNCSSHAGWCLTCPRFICYSMRPLKLFFFSKWPTRCYRFCKTSYIEEGSFSLFISASYAQCLCFYVRITGKWLIFVSDLQLWQRTPLHSHLICYVTGIPSEGQWPIVMGKGIEKLRSKFTFARDFDLNTVCLLSKWRTLEE